MVARCICKVMQSAYYSDIDPYKVISNPYCEAHEMTGDLHEVTDPSERLRILADDATHPEPEPHADQVDELRARVACLFSFASQMATNDKALMCAGHLLQAFKVLK